MKRVKFNVIYTQFHKKHKFGFLFKENSSTYHIDDNEVVN